MNKKQASPFMIPRGFRLVSLSHGYYAIPAVVYNRMFRINKIYLAIIAVKALLILILSLTHGGIQCLQ